MPSTKYFLVKYKYKYFDISIHQVLINMYLSTSTVLDPNPVSETVLRHTAEYLRTLF